MKNRNSGERFLWQTTAQSLGRSISFELEIPPDGAVPGAHRHPGAVERFKALPGRSPSESRDEEDRRRT